MVVSSGVTGEPGGKFTVHIGGWKLCTGSGAGAEDAGCEAEAEDIGSEVEAEDAGSGTGPEDTGSEAEAEDTRSGWSQRTPALKRR